MLTLDCPRYHEYKQTYDFHLFKLILLTLSTENSSLNELEGGDDIYSFAKVHEVETLR